MKRSFYVDDLMTGDKTTQACSKMHELREKVQQCELHNGTKLHDKTKSADES